jgi:putative DNA primase/helicase
MMTRIFPDEETRNFARRMIGYILTGDHNLQVHFLWYGVGGTGKSTLMDILVRFLDSYAAIASEDAFLLNKFGNSNRFALANLIMKILVGIQEAPAGREYNYSLIKAWDAKDKMSIDEKGKPIYNAYPHGPLVILTNHEPYIDPSEVNSVSRRHIILPFEAIVARDNPRIVTEIIQEESSGLLNYFIECISMYRKDGLNVPKTINDLTKNWAEFHQPVKSFIVDNMKFSVGKSTKASDVFDEYEEYSSSIDEDAVSRKKFYTILKSEGYKLNQGRDKALYLLDYEWNYASDWMQKRANEKSKFDPAIGICRIR